MRPDSKRNREFLEAFALDTLKMVGTMRISGQYYGLVRASDGLVHRVLPGNYLGQNEGRITTHRALEDQHYRDRPGRSRRLYGARRRARPGRMTAGDNANEP